MWCFKFVIFTESRGILVLIGVACTAILIKLHVMYKISFFDSFSKVFTQTWKLHVLTLNLVRILKERFEVERAELQVVVCLTDGNLASLKLGQLWQSVVLMDGMGKRKLWRGMGKREQRTRNGKLFKIRNLKMENLNGHLKTENVLIQNTFCITGAWHSVKLFWVVNQCVAITLECTWGKHLMRKRPWKKKAPHKTYWPSFFL